MMSKPISPKQLPVEQNPEVIEKVAFDNESDNPDENN